MASVSAVAPGAPALLDTLGPSSAGTRRAPPRKAGTARLLLAELIAYAGWRRLAGAALLIFVGAALEGVGILLILPVLQMFLEPGVHGALADRAPADWLLAPIGPRGQYAILFAGFAGLIVLRGVTLVARDTGLARLSNGFVEVIKLGFFERLAVAPWKDVMAIDRARLMKALGNDMQQVGLVVHFSLQTGAAVLALIAYCGFALALAPKLSLLALAILAAVGFAGSLFVRRAGAFGRALIGHDLRMAESATRFLSGLKLAKAQYLQAGFLATYAEASKASMDSRVAFIRTGSVSRQFTMLIGALAVVAAVAAALLTTDAKPATLIAFVILLSRTTGPIAQVQNGKQQVAHSLPAYAELRGLSDQLASGRPAAGFAPASRSVAMVPPSIALHSASLLHRSGENRMRRGLHAADLEIASGEFVGLSGPTGAGKSTLLDLVAALERPDTGTLLVDGRELSEAELVQHGRSLAYLGSDPVLFAGTLRSNLSWAAPESRDEAMWAAIEAATARDLAGRLGGGLDSRLHEAGANLSAGERQQIALARALLRRPALLLLDEATSSLDAERERRVLENLAALEPRPTILLVSHRAESFALCDRVVTLSEGQITSVRRAS